MKKNNKSLNLIKIEGNGQINFINNCISNGVVLENINRTSTKEMFCYINDNGFREDVIIPFSADIFEIPLS